MPLMIHGEALEKREQWMRMEKERMQKMTKVVTQNRDLMGCSRVHRLPLLSLQTYLAQFGVNVREEQRKKGLARGKAEVGDVGYQEGQQLMRMKFAGIDYSGGHGSL